MDNIRHFSAITLLSVLGYIFKINIFLISKSLAPSGFTFNIIALVTGSIWKPTWGTWWAWDAEDYLNVDITTFLWIIFISLEDIRK